jgi:Uncharacterised nucleotidyltransferase
LFPLKTDRIPEGLSAELQLACLCCRWPLPPNHQILSAAATLTDWSLFLPILKRQRIAGLANHALNRAHVELPSEIAAALASSAMQIARQNLLSAAESVRLQSLLERAGIPSIHLKGASLAQLAYGSLAVKQSKDIDIFLSPGHLKQAFQLL